MNNKKHACDDPYCFGDCHPIPATPALPDEQRGEMPEVFTVHIHQPSQEAQPLSTLPTYNEHFAIPESYIVLDKLQYEAELSRLTSKEEQGGWIERKQQAISVLEWADQGDHEHAMDCVKEALDLLRPTPPDSRKD